MARDPSLDITYDCLGFDRFGVYGQGILSFSPDISAEIKTISIINAGLSLAVGISGNLIISMPQSGDALDFGSGISISGLFIIGPTLVAKVKWSNIGEFNFDIDRKNLAGEMPLGWRGKVWQILQLGSKIIVYGSGGISQLTPHENAYGKETLSSIGITSEWSVVGTEEGHFFIDQKGRLGRIGDKFEFLGYEEFLKPMTDPIMLYDNLNRLLYICDGVLGYIYNAQYHSMGSGPVDLTGIGYSKNEEFIVSSSSIIGMPGFEITTDILDFGTRNRKTIKEIEVGTNLAGDLEVTIYYSIGINSSFNSTGWKIIASEGRLQFPCFGEEFKIGLRYQSATPFKIDYIKIKAVIHEYSPLES